jgi:hypothetical protein
MSCCRKETEREGIPRESKQSWLVGGAEEGAWEVDAKVGCEERESSERRQKKGRWDGALEEVAGPRLLCIRASCY